MRTPRPWPLPRQPATRAQLLSPTVTDAMVRTAVRTGRLLRLRPGVYLAADCWPNDPAQRQLMLARAEPASHPGAVLSHESAALVWGLPSPRGNWHSSPPSITLPRPSGSRAGERHTRHHSARIPPHHVTTDQQGYPITTIVRTAVDLARGRELPASLVLLDAAARLHCASLVSSPRRSDFANLRLARFAREALAEAASGRSGSRHLASAIALVDPRRESPIESLSAAHFRLAGLPTPDFQRAFTTARGTFYADCYWEQERLIGEADGVGKYADPQEIAREKEREQLLRDAGYRVVRWLGREILARPDLVIARVSRELAG